MIKKMVQNMIDKKGVVWTYILPAAIAIMLLAVIMILLTPGIIKPANNMIDKSKCGGMPTFESKCVENEVTCKGLGNEWAAEKPGSFGCKDLTPVCCIKQSLLDDEEGTG